MSYAKKTDVAVSKTKGEIDALLRKHKAVGFGVFEELEKATMVFEMQNRRIVFYLPLPKRGDPAYSTYMQGAVRFSRTADAAEKRWEQACRSRWRALFLCIKAKLESIESKIETFDDAFMAHVMMPDGQRFSAIAKPVIDQSYLEHKMVPLLPGPRQ